MHNPYIIGPAISVPVPFFVYEGIYVQKCNVWSIVDMHNQSCYGEQLIVKCGTCAGSEDTHQTVNLETTSYR